MIWKTFKDETPEMGKELIIKHHNVISFGRTTSLHSLVIDDFISDESVQIFNPAALNRLLWIYAPELPKDDKYGNT